VTVNHFDVAVVGGGLVGAACAYELAAGGTTVVVVDAHHPGRATDAGAGILSPESFGPSPAPLLALADAAGDHYRALVPALRDAGAPDPRYDVCGALRIAFREVDDPFYVENRELAFTRHGDVLRDIPADRARELFPPITDVRAAYLNPRGARVDGRALTAALVLAARLRRVDWRSGRVAALVVEHGRVAGVDTDGGRIACGAVVVAGGAWTPELASAVGLRVGVHPLRGQIVHLRVDADTGTWPVLQPVLSHYVVPWPEGRLALGATMEDVGFDARPTIGGMRQLLAEGLRVAPGLADATFLEVRAGLRPMSDDDLPILGPVPDVPGVFVASGHGAEGLLLGPFSGRLVAAAVHGEPPVLDLEPFSPARLA
jgi:D-amino-acid dehydrogenase